MRFFSTLATVAVTTVPCSSSWIARSERRIIAEETIPATAIQSSPQPRPYGAAQSTAQGSSEPTKNHQMRVWPTACPTT